MSYKPTIGLEVHIELNTKTKMFCGCTNDPFHSDPNTNICPICLAHPGAMPTINQEAVEYTIKLGHAINGNIAKICHFDRKSYFYPDLPKGYQISQYKNPLVEGGSLKDIKITRVHLEEDTGKLLHGKDKTSSSVDYNRAGVPLMELVTEPDIKNGKQAMDFARELQLILRYLHISNADMEKGEMRVEANISISKTKIFGTKVEVKNLNSFKVVGDAIDYEIKRQEEVLESGEEIIQETRGWDDVKKKTISQRSKEEAEDYRYFPEPDLPELDLTGVEHIEVAHLKRSLPELPEEKRARFRAEYDLDKKQADMLVADPPAADFFEQAASELDSELSTDNYQLLFNYLTSDLFGIMKDRDITFETLQITPENFADLVALGIKGEISSRMTKDILLLMAVSGDDPRDIIKREGLEQVSDTKTIEKTAKEVIKENEKAVEDYKKGNENSLKFLLGQSMKKLKGQGDPAKIEEVLKKLLS